MANRLVVRLSFLSSIVLAFCFTSRDTLAEMPARPSIKSYWAEVAVFSVKPGEGIESIEGVFSGGGFGPGATWGTSIKRGESELELSLQGQLKEGRFIVKLTASEEAGKKKKVLPWLSNDFDLTDMATKSIELAKDLNGRVHYLRLVPKVIESPVARRFDVKELRLEHFSFNDSTVLLDDQDYLGSMGMSSGVLAYLDIAGVAKVEFSLIPFKGAIVQGRLHHGTIHIHHEGRSIEIREVSNGQPGSELQGGPFALYIRWSPPTFSEEEARELQKSQLEELRSRVKDGEVDITEERLKIIEQNFEKRRVSMSYGLGPIRDEDR